MQKENVTRSTSINTALFGSVVIYFVSTIEWNYMYVCYTLK